MKIQEIPTPALIIEKDAFESNFRTMADLLKRFPSMRLYPHYKSHKCLAIARRQMAEGAGGITCAKLSEAEDLVRGGIPVVVIANQITQPEKFPRLAAIAKAADVTVCVDDEENIAALGAAMSEAGAKLRVLVEFEVGLNRCGVGTREEFLSLVEAVERQPALVFDGIQAYAGQLSHEVDDAVRRSGIEAKERKVRELKAFVEAAGHPCRNVAGGSTGTVAEKPADTAYTQLQAGSYLLLDSTYTTLPLPFRQSLHVLTRVISVKSGRAVLDGGVKSFTMDQHAPVLPDLPGVRFDLNEEHVILFDPPETLKVNDLVRIVPGHCCTTMNANAVVFVVAGDEVVDRIAITARGES